MKIIIDTNVLVSAVLRGRGPRAVIQFVVDNPDCEWIVSEEILTEYKEVLSRPKFKLTSQIRSEWFEILDNLTTLIEVNVEIDFPQDRKDAKFLACAIAAVAKGTVVVSEFREQWGNYVVIKYEGTNIFGHYLHLSKRNVSVEQFVSGCQKIGEAGNTFSSNKTVATHLHYHEANGVRANSIPMQNFQENIPLQDNGKNEPNIPVTSQNYSGRN